MQNSGRQLINLPILIFVSFAIICCGKNPGEPAGTGSLSGSVTLVNENQIPVNDHSGVVVSLGDTAFTGITDSAGRWRIDGIPAGTYDVLFRKNGYGTSGYIGYKYLGGEDEKFPVFRIGQIPGFNVDYLSVSLVDDTLNFIGELSDAASYLRRAIIYFAADSSVSNEDFLIGISGIIPPSDSVFRLSLAVEYLRLNGFHTGGMQVYTATYGKVGASYIIDPSENRIIGTDVSQIPARMNFTRP